jgi:hypothetical protein
VQQNEDLEEKKLLGSGGYVLVTYKQEWGENQKK